MRDSRIERLADWSIGLFSPRRRFLRKHYRRMEGDKFYRELHLDLMRAYGYRNAKSGRNTPWLGGGGTADAEINNDLPALRNRSRELNRDDPIGSGLIGTFVKNVIGIGIRPQARTGNPEKNTNIENVFKGVKDNLARAENMTFNEFQRLVFTKVLEDGEVFIKKTKSSPESPVWFEVIEADRVGVPYGTKAKGEGAVVNGIEKDENGIIQAYWVQEYHPSAMFSVAQKNYRRIPADQIVHFAFKDRPGQTRGVPIFHSVLQDIHDLDLLLLASLKRTQIAACLAVFIESPLSSNDLFDATAGKYGFALDQDIEPGMIFKTYPGEKVQTLLPNFPVPELVPFIVMYSRRIGAALGVSWQIVLKDFSESTYSSARTDLLEARQTYTLWQSWIAEKLLNWIWFVTLEDAQLRGDIRLQNVTREELVLVHWIASGWKWVDPQKEAKATEIELKNKITTRRDVAASRGQDWEEVMKQTLIEEKKELEMRKKMELSPPAPPKQEGARDIEDVIDEIKDDLQDNKRTGKAEMWGIFGEGKKN